jgi:hypothetical protein
LYGTDVAKEKDLRAQIKSLVKSFPKAKSGQAPATEKVATQP